MSEFPPNPEQSGPSASGSLAQFGSVDHLSSKPMVDHHMAPNDGGSPFVPTSAAIITPASMVQPICETSRVLGVTNINYQVFVPSDSKPNNDSKVPSRTFQRGRSVIPNRPTSLRCTVRFQQRPPYTGLNARVLAKRPHGVRLTPRVKRS